MKFLQKIFLSGGIYRNHDNAISGASFDTPTPNDMYNQLRFFYSDLIENRERMNPIELSAWTHAEFVRIHPFADGNGRTSRLIMNYQLMECGLLPISIQAKDKQDYYNRLDIYGATRKLEPFAELIYELENKRLDEVIAIIEQVQGTDSSMI